MEENRKQMMKFERIKQQFGCGYYAVCSNSCCPCELKMEAFNKEIYEKLLNRFLKEGEELFGEEGVKYLKELTKSEEVVMKAIWDSDEKLELRGIVKIVNQQYEKDWKPQTVSTFLRKLVRKEYIALNRQGRIFTYEEKVKEEDYRKNQLKRLFYYLYRGNQQIFNKELKEVIEEGR